MAHGDDSFELSRMEVVVLISSERFVGRVYRSLHSRTVYVVIGPCPFSSRNSELFRCLVIENNDRAARVGTYGSVYLESRRRVM